VRVALKCLRGSEKHVKMNARLKLWEVRVRFIRSEQGSTLKAQSLTSEVGVFPAYVVTKTSQKDWRKPRHKPLYELIGVRRYGNCTKV
jgi:hypothetical protein